MRTLYIFLCFLFFLSVQTQAQDPTDAGIPDANHVLVVYNGNSTVSDSVMNYYVNVRGIPNPLNVVRLDNLVDQDITIDGETHRVKIVQVTDMIQDSVNNVTNPEVPTKHAFKYFLDNIATPIKTHLINNNLLSTIRYIVLCKGIPFRINSRTDAGGWSLNKNVVVDRLLCLVGETIKNPNALLDSCHLPDGSGIGLEGLIVKLSFGDVIDTVYLTGEEATNLTETEIAYSEAEGKFLTGDITSALQMYDGIISNSATDEEKYFAYERKYEIGRMTGQSPEYFNELGTTFTTLASNAQDSVNQKILNQH